MENKELEAQIREILEEAYEIQDGEDIDSFIFDSLPRLVELVSQEKAASRVDAIKEVEEKLEQTFDGCACGLHGYQVLPDCEEERHESNCARCVLESLKESEVK